MDYLKVLKTDAYSFHIGLWGKSCFGEVGSIGDWVIDCCIAGVLLFFVCVCVFWLVELLIFQYCIFRYVWLSFSFFCQGWTWAWEWNGLEAYSVGGGGVIS